MTLSATATHLSIGGLCAGLLVFAGLTPACSSSNRTSTSSASAAAAPLWGDMTPVVSVKELMRDMIDPMADNIFNAVGSTVTDSGAIVTTEPKSEEDWERIRIGAVTLAEGIYLLKVPRPFAPPGDLNDSVRPGATELNPEQIAAKVKRDPVEWNARIEALRNVGLEVLDIVKRKNVRELWDAGESLDRACENCHRSYWYPAEDAKFHRDLDRRLDAARERSLRPVQAGKPQR